MPTRKLLIIIGAIVIVVVGAFVVSAILGRAGSSMQPGASNPKDETTMGTVTGGIPSADIPPGDTFTIGTPKGIVTVKNFYKTAAGIVENSQVVLVQNNNYEVDYSTADSSFSITITGSPVAAMQTSAENDLLNAIGTSKQDACKLSVSVIVPVAVDPRLGGIHRLSFCP